MSTPLHNEAWSSKYRPLHVADCILTKKIKAELTGAVTSNASQHRLFYGSAGTSKTTSAIALANELNYEILLINGSNEGRLIDTLRNKIIPFAASVSFEHDRKCVIIDEADNMGADVQMACRNMFDTYEKNCTFFLTANYKNKIIPPIVSRCAGLDFTPNKSEQSALIREMYDTCVNIITDNNVSYDKIVVGKIVKKFFPDLRKCLNELQRISVVGSIDSSALNSLDVDDVDTLISHLKNQEFTAMRKWVASCQNLDMSTLVRKLYDKANDYLEVTSMPSLILILNDYDYRSYFTANAEISCAAMCTKIMAECKFK